jgi:hypothetical protein
VSGLLKQTLICSLILFLSYKQNSQVACAEDDDGEFNIDVSEGITISGDGQIPPGLINPGGPFSALIPSMVPQEILVKLNSTKDTEDPNEQPEFR